MLRNAAATRDGVVAVDRFGKQHQKGFFFCCGAAGESPRKTQVDSSCASAKSVEGQPVCTPRGTMPGPTSRSMLGGASFRQLLEQLNEQHEFELQSLRTENLRLREASRCDCGRLVNRTDVDFARQVPCNGSEQIAFQERTSTRSDVAGQIGKARGDSEALPALALGVDSLSTTASENARCSTQHLNVLRNNFNTNTIDESKHDSKQCVRFTMRHAWKAHLKTMMQIHLSTQNGQLDFMTLRSSVRSGSKRRYPMLADGLESRSYLDSCWDRLLGRCMLDPAHFGRTWWSFLSVILLAYDLVVVPVDCFFQLSQTITLSVMEWIARLFWTFDMPISFITGTFVAGSLEMRPSRVARSYLAVWFPLDLFLVTADWLSLIGLSGAADVFPLLRALRLLRLLRLLRVAKLQSVFHDFMIVMPESVVVCSGLVQLIILMCLTVHVLACVWYGIGVASPAGWAYELQAEPFEYSYFLAVHFTMTQLHGTTHIHPESAFEHGVSAATLLLGFIAAALFIGNMAHTINQITDSNHEHMQQSCRRYLRTRNVSVRLQLRLNKYLAGSRKRRGFKEQVAHEEELVQTLPSVLLHDLNEEVRKPVLISNRFLRGIGEALPLFLRRVCNEALDSLVFIGKECVFYAGDEGSSLLTAESGSLCYVPAPNLSPGSIIDRLICCEPPPTHISRGQYLSEAALWTQWAHMGDLVCDTDSTLLGLQHSKFENLVSSDVEITKRSVHYCRAFVSNLNSLGRREKLSDIVHFEIDPFDSEEPLTFSDHHFVFLSHYKEEAGTEAALIKEEMEAHIDTDFEHSANSFVNPIYLDSEDLTDLSALNKHVRKSHNLALLLTPGVLTRPWCVLEMVTAIRNNIPIVPIEIQRPGMTFKYPSEEFYEMLANGGVFGESGNRMLRNCGVEADEVAHCMRRTFQKIAMSYSPHKATKIRTAEVDHIVSRCVVRNLLDTNESAGHALEPRRSL